MLVPREYAIDFDAINPIVEAVTQQFYAQEVYCRDCWSCGCLCVAATMKSALKMDQAGYLALCRSWWHDCVRATDEERLVRPGERQPFEIHGDQPWQAAWLLKPASSENLPNYFGGLLAASIAYFAGFTQMTKAQFVQTCEAMCERVDRVVERRAKMELMRRAERRGRRDLVH